MKITIATAIFLLSSATYAEDVPKDKQADRRVTDPPYESLQTCVNVNCTDPFPELIRHAPTQIDSNSYIRVKLVDKDGNKINIPDGWHVELDLTGEPK